jgi:hypothetical protein
MAILRNSIYFALICTVLLPAALHAQPVSSAHAPPGSYHTSWIGNTFGGNGATPGEGYDFPSNGYGYWVQDSISAMAVSPDGTVFDNVVWDEGGHGVGLYKNGQPNNVPVVALTGNVPVANDFNTAGHAVCVDGSSFYVGNTGGGLLRFSWTPGEVNSSTFQNAIVLSEIPISLSCGNGIILVGYPDKVELRQETSMTLEASYPVMNLNSALLAPDGSLWIIAGGKIRHLLANGEDTQIKFPKVAIPISLAWGYTGSLSGSLIVTNNGPAHQVLFFDVSSQPKLISTFGVSGGLYSGIPGAVGPQKLFALRSADMDASGNLYVGMSFSAQPAGHTFIRAFSPSGALLWEIHATSFVDTFGFEPGSGGTLVYGTSARWQLNLSNETPGTEATLTAITLDPLQYPNDPRILSGYAAQPRLVDGAQLLYLNGQGGHGYLIFAAPPQTNIFHQVGAAPATGWAWDVTEDGDIWNGDAPGNNIALYALQSITGGQPVYNWASPRTWPRPADFSQITRLIYNKATDSLYLFGWLASQPTNGIWGTLGLTARRYDGWVSGTQQVIWTNPALPVSYGPERLNVPVSTGLSTANSLPAKDVSFAGDYLFIGLIKCSTGAFVPTVDILDAGTGQYVGTLTAGPAVGGVGGQEDMVGSVQATESADGEYLILVEDDWRAKNILFRWTP